MCSLVFYLYSTYVHLCLTCAHLCSTCVSLVFHLCSTYVYLCSSVFTCVLLVLTCAPLLFICFHLCSIVGCFRVEPKIVQLMKLFTDTKITTELRGLDLAISHDETKKFSFTPRVSHSQLTMKFRKIPSELNDTIFKQDTINVRLGE